MGTKQSEPKQYNYYCKQHEEKAIMVNTKPETDIDKILLCNKCIASINENANLISIQQAIDIIQENKNSTLAQINPFITITIDQISELKQQIELKQQLINKHLNNFNSEMKNWIILLNSKLINNESLNVIEDFQFLSNYDCHSFNQLTEQKTNEIKKINYDVLIIINQIVETLCQESTQLQIEIQQKTNTLATQLIGDMLQNDETQQSELNDQVKKQQFKQINTLQQSEVCWAISFNYNDTLMASGCGDKILLWKLQEGNENQIQSYQNLVGHTHIISFIIFSKKYNWLISSVGRSLLNKNDVLIYLWKEVNENEWIQQSSEIKHTSTITGLILYDNETQLISSSLDGSLIIWKVNYELNQIDYQYTVINEQYQISCISLNEVETTLLSFSNEKQIKILTQQNHKWQLKQIIQTEEQGYRICFINNNLFIWQQCDKGLLKIFEQQNEEFQENESLRIQLSEINKLDGFLFFPSKFNSQLNLLLHKQNEYIYLIKKNEQGILEIEDKIQCQTDCLFGNMSNDGKIVVTWNRYGEYQLFQII